MMVGRLISYWEGNFSGAMLNFGRVYYVMFYWFLPTSTLAPEILLADPCFNHPSGQRNAVVDKFTFFNGFCLSLLFWRKGTLLWKKHISRQFSRWFSELPHGGICKIAWRIYMYLCFFVSTSPNHSSTNVPRSFGTFKSKVLGMLRAQIPGGIWQVQHAMQRSSQFHHFAPFCKIEWLSIELNSDVHDS